MCRHIKPLRPPYVEQTVPRDIGAAALQYVQKVTGFKSPSPRNAAAFDAAVAEVARTTQHLLEQMVVRGQKA